MPSTKSTTATTATKSRIPESLQRKSAGSLSASDLASDQSVSEAAATISRNPQRYIAVVAGIKHVSGDKPIHVTELRAAKHSHGGGLKTAVLGDKAVLKRLLAFGALKLTKAGNITVTGKAIIS